MTGRLPGPPLWKVSNGGRALWIFPYLDWIPKDMIWENERVARVIAESQELLTMPNRDIRMPLGMILNPINLVRSNYSIIRLERNPDGGTLEENLPPELYARFAVLQARYAPRDRGLNKLRPLIAGRHITRISHDHEGLELGNDVQSAIWRLVHRNPDIKRTEITVREDLEGGYRDIMDRINAVIDSFPPELEQACFEQHVRHVEEDLDAMKSRANSWAQGYIDEFRATPLVFDVVDACEDLLEGSSSPDHEDLADIDTRLNQMWLDAAESALAINASTFAVLPINELLAEDGLLSKLKARGYEVREP